MVTVPIPGPQTFGLDNTAPRQNTYEARQYNGGSAALANNWDIAGGGRITARAHLGPPVVSGLALGLNDVAQGVKSLAKMMAKQEELAENADIQKETGLFLDDLRGHFAHLSEMNSRHSFHQAVSLTEKFLETRGETLMKGVNTERKKEILSNFLMNTRDVALNRAHAHRANGLERHAREARAGITANYLAEIEIDPQNWRIYIDRMNLSHDNLHHDEHPEMTRARHRAAEEAGFETAVKSLANTDRAAAYRLLESFDDDSQEGIPAAEDARFTLPLDGGPRLSSPFGPRTRPVTPKGLGSADHPGLDYAVPVGTPVMAAGAGKVTFVGDRGSYGKLVIIDHGNGRETRYAHLNDTGGLRVDQPVSQGQQIALSGNTGTSTGPHLHFEIRQNGQPVDPEKALAGPRPSLKAQMLKHIQMLDARDIQMEEAAIKKAGQEAQKELTDMKYGVEGSQPFTADEVVARRDVLSPTEYEKRLQEAQEGTPPPSHSNPEVIISLTQMAVNGDPELQNVADEELKAGRLTVSDYRAAINEGQQFRVPPVKMALEAIRLKVGYSEMNPNPDAGNSFIQAKQDYLAWLGSPAGKNASTTEKVEMGNRIGDNYRIIRMENSILSVPAPLFQVGSRMAPDIQKTIEATQAARDAGELTEDEYAEQAIRIKRIADILEQQQAEAIAASTRQSGGRK